MQADRRQNRSLAVAEAVDVVPGIAGVVARAARSDVHVRGFPLIGEVAWTTKN